MSSECKPTENYNGRSQQKPDVPQPYVNCFQASDLRLAGTPSLTVFFRGKHGSKFSR